MATQRQRHTPAVDCFHSRDVVERIMDHLSPLDAAAFACTSRLPASLLRQVAARWTKLKFVHRPIPDVEHLQKIAGVAVNVSEVWLECRWLSGDVAGALQHLPNLQELRLDHPEIDILVNISNLENLISLKLYECADTDRTAVERLCQQLWSMELRQLAIAFAEEWMDASWSHVKYCCGQLQASLEALELGPISSELVNTWGHNVRRIMAADPPGLVQQLTLEVSTINRELLVNLADNFPDLQELNLRDSVPRSRFDLTDDDLQEFATNGPLRKLSLVRTNGNFACSDIGAMYLISSCNEVLEQVTISGAPKLSDVTVTALLKCPQLRQLHLQGCRGVAGHAFSHQVLGIRELPLMVSVNLSHCSSIEDESVAALCRLCPNLTELNLTDTSTGDDAMASIVELRKLKQLVLNGCHITDDGLALFADTVLESGRAAVLSHLALRGCQAITDVGVLRLADRKVLPAVCCLDLTGVAQITNEGLVPMLDAAQHLSQLKLRGCSRLTSQVLLKIASDPTRRRLTLLDVCHCEGLGVKKDREGIVAIINMLARMNEYPRLERLYLGCSGLKREAMFAAMREYGFAHGKDSDSWYPQVLVYHFDDEITTEFHDRLFQEQESGPTAHQQPWNGTTDEDAGDDNGR